jgi:hypothetical protein
MLLSKKYPEFLVCAAMIGLIAIAAVSANAQEMSQEEMMKAYMEAAKVGPAHELLAKMEGTWKATVKAYQDPASPPDISHGKNVAKLVLGGRFLQSDYEGTMMGMPMHGLGFLGYDNTKKEYIGMWMDNMTTAMLHYSGKFDEKTKSMTCYGDGVDPLTGMEYTTRMVTTIVNDDTHVWEMYSPGPDGKEVRWVEITYERQ